MDMPGGSVLLATLLCVFLAMWYKLLNSKRSSLRLPPGPPKLPIIGNLHQMAGSLPHHAMRDLASKYGPIMHLQIAENSNVVITCAELAKEFLKTHDVLFANRPDTLGTRTLFYNNTTIAFSPYGDHWRQLRKICTLELLSAKRVRSFRFIREEEVFTLVKDIFENEGSVINLREKISTTSNIITSRAAFGKYYKDQDAFLSALKEVHELVGTFFVANLFPSVKVLPWITGQKAKFERVHAKIDKVLENVIKDHAERKEKKKEEEENLLDVLLRIQKSNDLELPLSHKAVKAVILDMFTGGSDTSVPVMEWAMVELLKNPETMKKAQAEVRSIYKGQEFVDESKVDQLKYLNSVVKETLRLHPPGVLLLPRISNENCVLNGYDIPANTIVSFNAYAIGRDPKYWDEAERFKPERFLENPLDFKGTELKYIPFGVGRRMCPGSSFAIPNVELPLANLLYHFDWKLPNGITAKELDMTEHYGAGMRRKEPLHLIPIRYHPQP